MSTHQPEARRAVRIAVHIPTLVEAVGQPEMTLHDNLRQVYQRVESSRERVGQKFPGVIRDLSTNGAFISGEPLPLLSRIAFTFSLEGVGQVEALAWSLWRRESDCEIPRDDGTTLSLPRGFGVLFEAIPIDARLAIHKLVSAASVV